MANSIEYEVGGRSLVFEVVSTESVQEHEHVDERGNYVYTEITCRWNLVLNPATAAWRRVLNIVRSPGGFGGVTLEALEFHLGSPRGILTWTVGDEIQLQTPAPGTSIDARNGPIPKVISINEVQGQARTLEITWEVQTFLCLAERFSDSLSPLKSHTWEQTETLGGGTGRYYSVRITRGRCVFDTGLLAAAGTTPDQYRPHLLPRCPGGFHRDVTVNVESSGESLTYVCVDTEHRIGSKVSDVTNFECIHSQDLTAPGITTTLSTTAATATTGALGVAGAVNALSGASSAVGVTAARLGVVGAAVGAVVSLSHAITSSLPTRLYNCVVRVWGTKNISMEDLQYYAFAILMWRLRGQEELDVFTWNQSYHVLHDPVAGMVEVNRTYSSGAFAPLLGGAGALNPNNLVGNMNHQMTTAGDDLSPTVAIKIPVGHNINAGVTAGDRGSNLPPLGNQTRGYTMAKIVAQEIADFLERPSRPAIESPNPIPTDPHAT